MTIFPAPCAATASIAAWKAAVSSVTPSPFAPKSLTSNAANAIPAESAAAQNTDFFILSILCGEL